MSRFAGNFGDPPAFMSDGAEEIVAKAEEILSRHEREEHDGEPCRDERAGLVAFIAHRIGVRDRESIMTALKILAEYERRHHVDENGHV